MERRGHPRPRMITGVLLAMMMVACSTGASENSTRAHATAQSSPSPSATAASAQSAQATSPSTTTDEGENHPQAVFSETTYNAGTVPAGTEITHTFRVVNTGKADLVIERVKPG